MYKLNLIAVVTIVAAVSLVVGMTSPAVAFADDNSATMNMDNMALMGNMTGNNSTSMAGNMTETDNLTIAEETGLPGDV